MKYSALSGMLLATLCSEVSPVVTGNLDTKLHKRKCV